ncbi:MAG TPA: hypothetical protein VK094_07810 [Pseudogracilibacillus sp.]|nr:hypothetical protein [Pseudogracilibacillus sp.]
MSDPERIIMLPEVKKSLKEQMYQYMKEHKYTDALAIANNLIEHEIDELNINITKLSCLTSLNKLEEALIFIEGLLGNRDENYYAYFEIYIGLLYETNQYDEVMFILDEQENIPKELQPKFNELYRMAFQTNEKIKMVSAKELLTELEIAINTEDDLKQWNLINQLKKINVKPPNNIVELLKLNTIHPVVKTSIFNWLRELDVKSEVEVVKFNQTKTFTPSETASLTKNLAVTKTMLHLRKIEEDNPTLYQMIEELLIKFIYVNYPILYDETDAKKVAIALESVSEQSLYGEHNHELSKEVIAFMNDIQYCYKVYFEVIES